MAEEWVMTEAPEDSMEQADAEAQGEHGPLCLKSIKSDSEIPEVSLRCQGRCMSPRSQSTVESGPLQEEEEEAECSKSDSELILGANTSHFNIGSDLDDRLSRPLRRRHSHQRVHMPTQEHPDEVCSLDKDGDLRLSQPTASDAQPPAGYGASWPFLVLSVVFGLTLAVACAIGFQAGRAVDDAAPAVVMARHSAEQLARTHGMDKASIAVLQDKLQLQQMQVDMDTQVFTASHSAAKDMIRSMCNLPQKLCNSMTAAAASKHMRYHKKSSVPLDSNRGSYYAVWMWVKETGVKDEVQVAFKAASLSYQLRDVVTYRNQVDDEPVIKCETATKHNWLFSDTREHCREVARRKTVTPMPVFKQAIMNPEEMQLVDTLMESMLATKALENLDVGKAQLPASPEFAGIHEPTKVE